MPPSTRSSLPFWATEELQALCFFAEFSAGIFLIICPVLTKPQACGGKGVGWGRRNMPTVLCYWIHGRMSLTLVSSFLPRVLRQHRGVGIIGVRAWDSRGDSRGTSSAKLFSLLEEKCSAQSLGELRIPEWGVENCGRGMGSSCTWGMGLHLSQAWLANQLLSPVWVLFKHSLFIHRSVH